MGSNRLTWSAWRLFSVPSFGDFHARIVDGIMRPFEQMKSPSWWERISEYLILVPLWITIACGNFGALLVWFCFDFGILGVVIGFLFGAGFGSSLASVFFLVRSP